MDRLPTTTPSTVSKSTCVEARFGEELVVDVSARVLDQQGLDGNAYRNLSRQERSEFNARQYADTAIPTEH